jgi:hypothetical protein
MKTPYECPSDPRCGECDRILHAVAVEGGTNLKCQNHRCEQYNVVFYVKHRPMVDAEVFPKGEPT